MNIMTFISAAWLLLLASAFGRAGAAEAEGAGEEGNGHPLRALRGGNGHDGRGEPLLADREEDNQAGVNIFLLHSNHGGHDSSKTSALDKSTAIVWYGDAVDMLLESKSDGSAAAAAAAVDAVVDTIISLADGDIVYDLREERTIVARFGSDGLVALEYWDGVAFALDEVLVTGDEGVEGGGAMIRPLSPADLDDRRRKLSQLQDDGITVLGQVQSSGQSSSSPSNEKIPSGVSLIQADQLDSGLGFPHGKVKVCVADTGYASFHPDLAPFPTVNGIDMKAEDGTTYHWDIDRHSTGHHTHGTFIAGIISAIQNNDIGLRGVVDPTKIDIFITRALRDDNAATQSQMLDAVSQCVDAGSHVIALAVGCLNCHSIAFQNIFHDIVVNKGIIVVSAAGNTGLGEGHYFYPASYPDVISVAAVDDVGKRFPMSNANDAVELAAHGNDVFSTFAGEDGAFGYGLMDGTSAATAYVAGAAALLWSHYPACTNDEIRNALAKTAHNTNSNTNCDSELGHGIVKVKEAYYLLQRHGCGGGSWVLSNTARTCDPPPPPTTHDDAPETPEGQGGAIGVIVVRTGGANNNDKKDDGEVIKINSSNNNRKKRCKDLPKCVKVTHRLTGEKLSCRKLRRSIKRKPREMREQIRCSWCRYSDADDLCQNLCRTC